MKKTFKQKIHDFWYVKPHEPNKAEYTDNDGVFYQDTYDEFCQHFIKEARDQQNRNRLAVFVGIGLVIAGVCIILYLFQILLCIGLFLTCITMLLN